MSEAATEPAPRPPVTLEELIERQNVLLARGNDLLELNAGLLRPLGRRAGLPPDVSVALTDQADRLADYQGELRETRQLREREVRLRTVEEMFERATAPLEVPAEPDPRPRRKGGHRKRDLGDRARMRLAGFAPAGGLAWAAQHAVGLGVTGAAATVTLGTALTLTAPLGHAASQVRHDLHGPVASAPLWTAVPVPSPSRTRSGQDVNTAAPAPSPSAVAPVVTADPPQPSPSATPEPGLLVSARDLDLSGTSGTFTLTAPGDAVNWSVSTDIPGASLSVVQGVLDSAQEPVTVVLVDPLGESGTVYVRWGDRGIATIWVTSSLGGLPVPLPSSLSL